MVYEASAFDALNKSKPFDLSIYHQGNNPFHEYIYKQALQHPGLVVFHEHCLHHLIAWQTLGRDDEDAYRDEMFLAYGRRGSEIADMRARDVGSEYQQFVLPLNRRLVSRSLGIIVHNPYAASQLEASRSGLPPVEIIPHHLSPRVFELDKWDRMECRRHLGIPDDKWVVASLGFVTQSKRIPVLLNAFKHLLDVVPNAFCLIAGEDHWKWSVAPMLGELGIEEQSRITGYIDEIDFFRYLKAADVVVNLRYPTAGETSGTLIRTLGAGKPVIVSDFGQFADFPEEICLKVAPGENEERDLYSALRKLAYRPLLRETLGRKAAEYIREDCEIGKSAAHYLAFAERIIGEGHERRQPARPVAWIVPPRSSETITLDRIEALEYLRGFFDRDQAATGYIGRHGQRIIRTVELLPPAAPGARLLELSSYLQMTPLIKRYGHYEEIAVTNWWPIGDGDPREKVQRVTHSITGEELSLPMQNVNVERDRFPYADGHFDVALCCELIEHLQEDPIHMLAELNRVLKWGGLLILTTPNVASAFSIQEMLAGSSPYIYGSYNVGGRGDRHSREYTPKDVRLALESAGFKIERLFTEDLWHEPDAQFIEWLNRSGASTELRGDNIFAVARKASEQIDRYPASLYD